jgi:hypothetical protein
MMATQYVYAQGFRDGSLAAGQCDADRAQLSRLTKRRDERKVAPMNFRAVCISLIITIIPGMVG